MPITHITKCLLCDPTKPFTVSEPAFDQNPELVNGVVPERLSQYNMKLLGHIQKGAEFEQKQVTRLMKQHHEHGGPAPDLSGARHLMAWNDFVTRTALAQGTAILSAFDTTDPAIQQMKEQARWKLHDLTRKFFFTDQMIEDAIVQLNLDLPDQENVLNFAKQMRDALLEQGEYAPKMEQPLVSLT